MNLLYRVVMWSEELQDGFFVGGAVAARAVCAEVLQVVHHCPVGDWDLSTRLWAIAVAREMAARW